MGETLHRMGSAFISKIYIHGKQYDGVVWLLFLCSYATWTRTAKKQGRRILARRFDRTRYTSRLAWFSRRQRAVNTLMEELGMRLAWDQAPAQDLNGNAMESQKRNGGSDPKEGVPEGKLSNDRRGNPLRPRYIL